MASGVRVQNYLEKHKIGALFEELMGRVISDQPDEPILYVMHMLERKANKQGLTQTRRSLGDQDRPWQANMKKKTKRSTTADPTGSRPEFDARPMRTATTFDDLWNESKTVGGSHQQRSKSRSPPRRPQQPTAGAGGVSWAEDEDEDFLYKSSGYRGPRKQQPETGDPLAGEFGLAKLAKPKKASSNTAHLSRGRVKGQTVDARNHRRKLEMLILEERQRHQQQLQQDSGIEEEDKPEEGMVILESLEDLEREGVNIRAAQWKKAGLNVQHAGRALKLMRQRLEQRQAVAVSADPAAGVRVSICATCAKLMQGGAPSEPAPGLNYGQLPDFKAAKSGRDVSRHKSAGPRVSPRSSDDEFESVSQVTGPRRPVWQEDSDVEARKPKKGTHMFASSGVPAKGRPMFSAAGSGSSPAKMAATVTAARSEDFTRSKAGLKGHADFQKTWAAGDTVESEARNATTEGSTTRPTSAIAAVDTAGRAVADTEAADDTTFVVGQGKDEEDAVGTESAFGRSSHGWQVPATDYDTDTSDVGANGRKYYSGQF